jgi:glutamate racemase
MTHQDSAIGVFDSGIGGFTVLHEIIEARPKENTIYLRDPRDYPMAQNRRTRSGAIPLKTASF